MAPLDETEQQVSSPAAQVLAGSLTLTWAPVDLRQPPTTFSSPPSLRRRLLGRQQRQQRAAAE